MSYDPSVSLLPDGGGAIKPMMGGGSHNTKKGGGTDKSTVTILGESYRIRKEIGSEAFDSEDER